MKIKKTMKPSRGAQERQRGKSGAGLFSKVQRCYQPVITSKPPVIWNLQQIIVGDKHGRSGTKELAK